jgi:hypothetical protein
LSTIFGKVIDKSHFCIKIYKTEHMKKYALVGAVIVTLLAVEACSPKVTRIDPNEQIDLSGRWNETDSRLVAEQMIQDAFSRPWISDHQSATGNKPVMVVGIVRNKSHEHISTETFIKDIEREMLNSGKVKVVQAGAAREDLRKERGEQQEFASQETAKKWGQELGADFMLQGTVNSIVDSDKKSKVVFYQIDMELTNIETNEKVWIGNKKIKKLIDK